MPAQLDTLESDRHMTCHRLLLELDNLKRARASGD
jgi:hypothetical protein